MINKSGFCLFLEINRTTKKQIRLAQIRFNAKTVQSTGSKPKKCSQHLTRSPKDSIIYRSNVSWKCTNVFSVYSGGQWGVQYIDIGKNYLHVSGYLYRSLLQLLADKLQMQVVMI